MSVLYITSHHAYAGIEQGILYVKSDSGKTEYRLGELERIAVFGNVAFSAKAVTSLLREDIPVVFISRRGSYKGTLHKPSSKNVFRRVSQYRIAGSQEAKLEASRRIVQAKIQNGFSFIEKYHAHKPLKKMQQYRDLHRKIMDKTADASDAGSMRGLEGIGAKLYFHMFSQTLPEAFAFKERNRRPPKDPVNSMLSFSYTLLVSEFQALCEGHGLDPFMGFYHEPDYGRPSLAADLCEEFRSPLVDRFVLHCTSRSMFSPDDFSYDEEAGCRFTPEALNRFISGYENWISDGKKGLSWRDRMRVQADKMAFFADGKGPYEPFRYGGEGDDDDREL